MASSSSSFSISGLADISALAEQFMQEQFQWGQAQFAKNSVLTDQVVGDLLNLYGSMSGIGNTLMSEYSNFFVPEYQKLVNDANNYSSAARVQQAMGAAESGVSQSFNGQRNAALADLQSFGIDPSSGRYAALDTAERTQQAAAMAGAGFQAEQATEATGRALRSEALQLGSVMPSQATGAYNAAAGAATAAENARLANSQEGVNMMGSPVQWGGVGQQFRQSGSQSSSSNPSKGGGSGGGGGRGAGGPGGFGPQPGVSPQDTMGPNTAAMGGQMGAGAGSQPSAGIASDLPGGGFADNTAPAWDSGANPASDYLDPSQNSNYDPFGSQVTQGDTYQSPSPSMVDQGTLPADSQGGPSFGADMGTQNPGGNIDNPWDATNSQDFTAGDTMDVGGAGQDSGGSFDGSSYDSNGYADGGVIPHSKSPSRGRVTDDVPAQLNGSGEPIRLNAGEFIMPRHAVQWYGEKHLQNMVEKSQAGRKKAPARPQLKPALPSQRGAIPTSARYG